MPDVIKFQEKALCFTEFCLCFAVHISAVQGLHTECRRHAWWALIKRVAGSGVRKKKGSPEHSNVIVALAFKFEPGDSPLDLEHQIRAGAFCSTPSYRSAFSSFQLMPHWQVCILFMYIVSNHAFLSSTGSNEISTAKDVTNIHWLISESHI